MKCKFCDGEIPEHVVKCQHCGEWLDPNHFISLLNTTEGFKSIQKILIANITEAVQGKLVSILTIAVPIILFLLGGSGILLIKAAVSDSIITMKKAEYVVENAKPAIEEASKLQSTLDTLEKSKIKFQAELTILQENVQQFRQKTADITTGNIHTVERLEKQMKDLQQRFVEINARLMQIATSQGKSQVDTISLPNISAEQQKQVDESKKSLKRKAEYVKYLIQINKFSHLNPLSTRKIETSLALADFETIVNSEKISFDKTEKYTSLMIGKDIPNDILNDFFTVLYPLRNEFTYIRFNEDNAENNKIFIGVNNKLSQERKDTRLNHKIWTELITKNSDIQKIIQALEKKPIN